MKIRMKFLFILPATMCLIFCGDDPQKKSGTSHRNPELTGDNLNPEDEGSGPEGKYPETEPKKEPPVNSLKIAKTISNFKDIKKGQ